MIGQFKVPNSTAIGDRFAFVQVQQVDDCSTATFTAELRQAVYFLPINSTRVGKEQQIVVSACGKQVSDWIFVLGLGSFKTFATTTLCSISADRRPFDITAMRNRHDHIFFGDQIFEIDITHFMVVNFRATRISKPPPNFCKIVGDDGVDIGIVRENTHVLVDLSE